MKLNSTILYTTNWNSLFNAVYHCTLQERSQKILIDWRFKKRYWLNCCLLTRTVAWEMDQELSLHKFQGYIISRALCEPLRPLISFCRSPKWHMAYTANYETFACHTIIRISFIAIRTYRLSFCAPAKSIKFTQPARELCEVSSLRGSSVKIRATNWKKRPNVIVERRCVHLKQTHAYL